MKQSVAKKWSKALRSGKFKQTKDVLFNKEENSYCCLGVLCVLAGKEEGYLKRRGNAIDNPNVPGPIVYKTFAGMNSADGRIAGDVSPYFSLAHMNDSDRSFKQIANFIDKHWKIL